MFLTGLVLLICFGAFLVVRNFVWNGWPSSSSEMFVSHSNDTGRKVNNPGLVKHPPQKLQVRAIGREFQWHFVYPGEDREFGSDDDIDAGNTLRVPVGSEIELLLSSDDYIYIFNLPEFGIREIAVPEMVHRVRFQANLRQEISLITDPLCGLRLLHDGKMGHASILSGAEFLDWFEQTKGQSK